MPNAFVIKVKHCLKHEANQGENDATAKVAKVQVCDKQA
jgi:hypothetical protein